MNGNAMTTSLVLESDYPTQFPSLGVDGRHHTPRKRNELNLLIGL
ncbi:hypothetical protein [Enterobacter phage 01_vB_Eclo_IJM]|nr:hypothetical protein [Enterobacter phage 01_vB_Eclo_IJM]